MRRRSITRERAENGALAQLGPPATVREAVNRALELERAIESALKGGFCPNCGARIGRGVRQHFASCDGGAGV